MVVVRIPVRPVVLMRLGLVHNVGFFVNNGRLINKVLKVIFFSFSLLLGVATGHLVLILALLVFEVAFIFTRRDMSFIQVEVRIFIVAMVLFVMLLGGLTIKFPLLVGTFVLLILILIALVSIIVSRFMMDFMMDFRYYWCWRLMNYMVDRLVDVMDSFLR